MRQGRVCISIFLQLFLSFLCPFFTRKQRILTYIYDPSPLGSLLQPFLKSSLGSDSPVWLMIPGRRLGRHPGRAQPSFPMDQSRTTSERLSAVLLMAVPPFPILRARLNSSALTSFLMRNRKNPQQFRFLDLTLVISPCTTPRIYSRICVIALAIFFIFISGIGWWSVYRGRRDGVKFSC